MTWREEVAKSWRTGKVSDDMVRRAAAWDTCAVGEQHDAFPRVVVYRSRYVLGPKNDKLASLGHHFYVAIFEARNSPKVERRAALKKAEMLLDQIDDVVLALKRRTL